MEDNRGYNFVIFENISKIILYHSSKLLSEVAILMVIGKIYIYIQILLLTRESTLVDHLVLPWLPFSRFFFCTTNILVQGMSLVCYYSRTCMIESHDQLPSFGVDMSLLLEDCHLHLPLKQHMEEAVSRVSPADMFRCPNH